MFQPMLPFMTERKRLSEQCQKIVDALSKRAMTNDELSRISRKYTSRISDIRAAGYDIRCVYHDRETGLTRYQLFS